MRLPLRVLMSRMRQSGTLILLRLVGLTLAALVAGSVPTFVAAAMERVLQQELAALAEPPAVVVSWAAPDDADYAAALAAMDDYLGRDLPRAAGVSGAEPISLPATGQRAIQQIQADGRLRAAKRYFSLAPLPADLPVISGRLPAAGAAEVVLSDAAMVKAGYQAGDRVRVPLTADAGGEAVEMTVVGIVRLPDAGALGHLRGALSGALLTSPESWRQLGVPTGEQTWALDLGGGSLHTAGLADLAGALRGLPLRTARLLPSAQVITTPLTWVNSFLQQMATTRALLVVLLTPVFLLIVFFALATANAVVSGRRVEVAVLRSRGLSPAGVVWFYAAESGLLLGAATAAGLALTPAAVRLMGLSAGFLRLVNRPLLPATITRETMLYALAAAALAEVISLVPLVRAARFTVATMRQEAATRSPVLAALQAVAELALVGVVGYGAWRLLSGGLPDDPLYLALPALTLAASGAVLWRLLAMALGGLARLLNPYLSPALHLALGLLRNQPGRYQGLWLMLLVTAGLGIYGAAFARTLDRDLSAQAQYRLGSDLVLRPAWESDVISVDAEGNPDEVVYNEPPFSQVQGLPGADAVARVQLRTATSLSAGSRNLGRIDVVAIDPQEFGQTARFISELTPLPPADYLNLLAQDEQAILVSDGAARRLGIKPGDRLNAVENGVAAPVYVAGTIPYLPGRLPGGGDFIVARLDYLQDELGLLPYSVWVRLTPAASVTAVVEELTAREVRLSGLESRRGEVASGRREPLRLALYATLSAGFVIALLVMALTYLLHVGLTLQSRIKELGVLQAMGMSARQVALSLYVEQLLIVSTAAVAGLAAGQQVAGAFVPALRRQPGTPLLPLQVAGTVGERVYVLLGFAVALGIGAAIVAVWIRRLAVNKALRLGEDG